MRNVASVVMWRWAQKGPPSGDGASLKRHITKSPRVAGLPVDQASYPATGRA
jgi:hypothetical protein